MPAFRDIILKRDKRLDKKVDKRGEFRAVITDAFGNQSGSGSIWFSQNTRKVWAMPIGGTQPFPYFCYRLTPVIGLGVYIGYASASNQSPEILRTDYELLGPSNTTGTSYESPSNLDFLPGGRLQLWLDPRLLQPLATYPNPTGLQVNVVSGDYLYGGARVTFAGETNIALTQNPNPGEHYLVGLYLDSANTLQIVYGTSIATSSDAPEPTWPAGAFQLSTVLIDDVQTSISMADDISNRRILWTDEDSFNIGFWPGPNTFKIGATEYATLALAVAAAVSGDTIFAGVGVHTADNVTIPAGVNLFGADPYLTKFTTSTSLTCLTFSAGCQAGNFTVEITTNSASTTQAISIASNNVVLNNVGYSGTNAGAGVGYGCNVSGGTGVELWNNRGNTSKTNSLFITGATTEVKIFGGNFDTFQSHSSGPTVEFVNLPRLGSAGFGTTGVKGLVTSGGAVQTPGLSGGGSLKLTTGATINLFDTDGTLATNSDLRVATQKAVKAYADAPTNYTLSVSVAANDLTVALKNLAGSDASATSPIMVRIGDTLQTITAALSTTKNDGTNWLNSGGNELKTLDVDYFCYLIQETGASAGTKIGFARIPYANVMGDFTNTTTSEKYIAGNWTNFNATDAVTLIGRFNAILSGTAAFNWSLTTQVIINRPIYETRWLTYTPTVTSAGGTITTVGSVAGAYQVAYNKLFFNHQGDITTNGTGTSAVNISLPFTPVADNSVGAGRENLVTGNMLQARATSNVMQYFTYANAYPGGDGRRIIGGGIALRLI